MPDTITQLTARGCVLVKQWRRGEDGRPVEQGYDRAKHFAVREHPVDGVRSLARVLDDIGKSAFSCVVRGALRDPAAAARTRRTKEHFADVPRRWSLHDFDSLDLPDAVDPADGNAVARYARSLLPPEFHDVTCWWAFTGSHGMKPGARLRLGFWHDRAVFGHELKTWLAEKVPEVGRPAKSWRTVCPVDASVYGTVQQIFVGRPIFHDGIADPVPRRSGLLVGRHEAVSTPFPILPRFKAVVVQGDRSKQHEASDEGHSGRGYAFHRGRIGDPVDGHEGDGFHEPMRAAAGAYFATHGAKADAEWLIADLTAAARAAPRYPGEGRADEVESRIAGLPELVRWTRERQALQEAPGAKCAPPGPLPSASLAEAETAVAAAVSKAVRARTDPSADEDVLRWFQPLPVVFDAGLGTGKTEAAVREVIALLERRPGARVAMFAPQHGTAADIAARLNAAAGWSIAKVWQGVSRPACEGASEDVRMCRMLPVVERVQREGGSIRDVCGGPRRGWCPHNPASPAVREPCGYRSQFDPAPRVWVFTHAMLPLPAPREFAAGRPKGAPLFDLVVVDEAPWLSLFGGLEPSGGELRLPALVTAAVRAAAGGRSADGLHFLGLVQSLRAALARQRGALKRAPLVEAGLTTEGARRAAALTWKVLRALPGGGPDVRLVARLWRLLGDFLASGEDTAPRTIELQEDDGGTKLRLRWRADIHRDWLSPSPVVLDATSIADVAQLWLAEASVTTIERAAEIAVFRVQLSDRKLGKSSLAGSTDEAEDARHARSLGEIARMIEVVAWRYRGAARYPAGKSGADVAVISHKTVVGRLRSMLPDNVEVRHFNAVRGLDSLGHVRCIVIIGRPEVSPDAAEIMAAVAAGRLPAARGGPYYDRADAALLMRNGEGRRVASVRHPDPLTDAFRRQVASELPQAEGRARGVRRGRGNPLTSIVLTSEPTSQPVDETVTLDEATGLVSPIALLAARGIVPSKSDDAGKLVADALDNAANPGAALRTRAWRDGGMSLAAITGGAEAASSATVTGPNRDPLGTGDSCDPGSRLAALIAGFPPSAFAWCRRFKYRLLGTRRSGIVLVDIRLHADPRRAVEHRLGSCDIFDELPPADWLRPWSMLSHAEHTPETPRAQWRERLAEVPSAAAAIIGTDHRWNPAPVLPVAEDVVTVTSGDTRLTAHSFPTRSRAPVMLVQTADATWPPKPSTRPRRPRQIASAAAPVNSGAPERRSLTSPAAPIAPQPATERKFEIGDVLAAARVDRITFAGWMMDPAAIQDVVALGYEVAAIRAVTRNTSRTRMRRVVEMLTAAPAAPCAIPQRSVR